MKAKDPPRQDHRDQIEDLVSTRPAEWAQEKLHHVHRHRDRVGKAHATSCEYDGLKYPQHLCNPVRSWTFSHPPLKYSPLVFLIADISDSFAVPHMEQHLPSLSNG